MTNRPPVSPPLRIWFFRLTAILLGTLVALLFAEGVLRLISSHISAADEMAPGLIRHDPQLGWRLSPGWRGEHRTFDYTTTYSTDARGLRQSDSGRDTRRRVLVLGDSFVFGLGVGNSETFVSCLNRTTALVSFVNGGIPGYSPDQVMLWAPTARLLSRSTEDLLVVYLGNDLLDIGEEYPFQAPYAKPAASLSPTGELLMLHQPVPASLKSTGSTRVAADLIGGQAQSLFAGSQIMRLLREAGLARASVDEDAILKANAPKLGLFAAVLSELEQQNGSTLTLAILPGASAVQTAGTLSAVYQGQMREQLLALAHARDLPVIDLFPALSGDRAFYFPNDGHLTQSGHDRVCEVLRAHFVAHQG
ncbi:MAG: GDSL-type esterase/lipase family protein [Pseudomonadota bacterium]